jgi:hypothetical protein
VPPISDWSLSTPESATCRVGATKEHLCQYKCAI